MQKKNTKNHFLNKHRYLLVGILCLFGICLLSAQDKKKVDSIEQKKTETPEKKKTRVDLLYADEAQADKQLRPDVQVLTEPMSNNIQPKIRFQRYQETS